MSTGSSRSQAMPRLSGCEMRGSCSDPSCRHPSSARSSFIPLVRECPRSFRRRRPDVELSLSGRDRNRPREPLSTDRLRPPHLLREPPEPRRQQKKLVDLVRWNRGSRLLFDRKNVINEALHLRPLLFRLRLVELRPHNAAANEIDAVVALVTRHRIRK